MEVPPKEHNWFFITDQTPHPTLHGSLRFLVLSTLAVIPELKKAFRRILQFQCFKGKNFYLGKLAH
jgi:hypothetical protein